MPALVKRSVGSWAGTRGDERTTGCPWRAKEARNCCRSSDPLMVMRLLYRASGGLVGPVGARPGEHGHGPHHHRRRVAAAQEVVAQAHRSAFPPAPKDRGQTPAAGVEAALGL